MLRETGGVKKTKLKGKLNEVKKEAVFRIKYESNVIVIYSYIYKYNGNLYKKYLRKLKTE